MFSPRRSPCRKVLFRGLRYKVDFLFRSFIFSWERFWKPRKKSRLSSPSCLILHLLRGRLRIPWHLSPYEEGDRTWRNARCSSAHEVWPLQQPSLAGAEVAGKRPLSRTESPKFASAAECCRFVWHPYALSRAGLRFFFSCFSWDCCPPLASWPLLPVFRKLLIGLATTFNFLGQLFRLVDSFMMIWRYFLDVDCNFSKPPCGKSTVLDLLKNVWEIDSSTTDFC